MLRDPQVLCYIERRNIAKRKSASELPDLLREEVTRIVSTHKPKELPVNKIEQIDRYLSSL